jgi:hypothetical protein
VSLRQSSQFQRPNRDPHQPQHLDPQPFKDAPDLPILPFIEHHLEPRVPLTTTQNFRTLHPQDSHLRFDPTHHRLHQLHACHCSHLHVISLLQMGLRRGHSVRPLRIIRQQQQPFAGFVQPPHRCHPGQVIREIRTHRLPPLFIGSRRHHAPRLVHHQVDTGNRFNRLSVDLNPILPQMHWRFRIAPRHAIHPHSTRPDQFPSRGTRAVPELRQRPRDPHPPQPVSFGHRSPVCYFRARPSKSARL